MFPAAFQDKAVRLCSPYSAKLKLCSMQFYGTAVRSIAVNRNLERWVMKGITDKALQTIGNKGKIKQTA